MGKSLKKRPKALRAEPVRGGSPDENCDNCFYVQGTYRCPGSQREQIHSSQFSYSIPTPPPRPGVTLPGLTCKEGNWAVGSGILKEQKQTTRGGTGRTSRYWEWQAQDVCGAWGHRGPGGT